MPDGNNHDTMLFNQYISRTSYLGTLAKIPKMRENCRVVCFVGVFVVVLAICQWLETRFFPPPDLCYRP
jgi:hypothetical protein